MQRLLPGYDYTREITLTHDLALGDTVLLYDGDAIVGFALAHTAPLVEGRAREELRVLKLVLADESRFDELVRAIADFARRSGTRRIALRLQGEFLATYQRVDRARRTRAVDGSSHVARRTTRSTGRPRDSCCRTGRSRLSSCLR